MSTERAAPPRKRLRTFAGLVRRRDALVGADKLNGGAYGCGLGSMAAELADQDEESRAGLAETFVQWEKLLADGFVRMQQSNVLRADADPERLATFLMAALQGGYRPADAAHDVAPMAIALDMALEQVKSYLNPGPEGRRIGPPVGVS